MSNKHLHIISFDIPLPANYGGVIDVFYRLKALSEAGVSIILHCFQYGDRKEQDALEEYCSEVHYYPRNTGISSQLTKLPYIVESRKNNALIERLIQDDYPILMEGIHCSYYIDDERLAERKKILRMHNIEWKYYQGLARSSKNIKKKLFFNLESKKLKAYENALLDADHILAINEEENLYFKSLGVNSEFLAASPPYTTASFQGDKKDFILYQASLDVSENIDATEWIIENLVKKMSEQKFIIAGKNPKNKLLRQSENYDNLEIIANPDEEIMEKLISSAQVNLVITFQNTGVKLKLLHALYKGGHCLANPSAVFASGIEECCEIATTADQFQAKIIELKERKFSQEEFNKRNKILDKVYSSQRNAQKIIKLI